MTASIRVALGVQGLRFTQHSVVVTWSAFLESGVIVC